MLKNCTFGAVWLPCGALYFTPPRDASHPIDPRPLSPTPYPIFYKHQHHGATSVFRFRLGIYRLTWKLDKDGNLENTRQGLAYCAYCKDVKEVVETVLTERV